MIVIILFRVISPSICYLKMKDITCNYNIFLFCGCQTGSVTLRDEYRLSDFQKLLPMNIFWAKIERIRGLG